MSKLPKPERPTYAIASVDNAIRLVHMLRDRGEVRLSTAAKELGVAESTVHRLMAMLIFHGLAVRTERRSYVPGPTVGAIPLPPSGTDALRRAAAEPIAKLAAATGETVNLQIRVGTKVRFLLSSEGESLLRVIAREGAVLPAAQTAGGQVLLAHLPEDKVRELLQGAEAEAFGDSVNDAQLQRLMTRLRGARTHGYAVSHQESEAGVAAIAAPLRDPDGEVMATVAIAVPSVRFESLVEQELIRRLLDTREVIENKLVEEYEAENSDDPNES